LFGKKEKEKPDEMKFLRNDIKQTSTELARIRMETKKDDEYIKKYLNYIGEALPIIASKIDDLQNQIEKLDNKIDKTTEQTKGKVKEIQDNIETTTSILIKMYNQLLKRFTLIIGHIGGELEKKLKEEDEKIKEILKTKKE